MKYKSGAGFTPLGFFKNFIGVEKNNQKTLTGFTLIEILVVLFIISLVSSSVMVSYWGTQNQYYASKAVQRLTVDLRRAQNMALSGATQGAVVPKGYGIYTQTAGQYILFYNADADEEYTGSSVLMETTALEGATLSPTGTSIYFSSPAPTTYINGVNGGSQIFTIISGNNSRGVVVDFGGRIDTN